MVGSMKVTTTSLKFTSISPATFRCFVQRSWEPATLVSAYLFAVLQAAFWVGVWFTEAVPNIQANIPEPIAMTMRDVESEPFDAPTKRLTKPVFLYVQPVDIHRLAETIIQDVDRHGGRTMSRDPNAKELTLVVPEDYLRRIQPFLTSSAPSPHGTEYQDWAHLVHNQPLDPSINGHADTAVSIRLIRPIFTNPITKTLAAWTAIPSLFVLLTIPMFIVAQRLSENPRMVAGSNFQPDDPCRPFVPRPELGCWGDGTN